MLGRPRLRLGASPFGCRRGRCLCGLRAFGGLSGLTCRRFGRSALAGTTRLALDGGGLRYGDGLLVEDLIDQFTLVGEGVGREADLTGDLTELVQTFVGELSYIISLHKIL